MATRAGGAARLDRQPHPNKAGEGFGSATIAIGLVEHLGDIVAGEPTSRLARRRYPDARIVWVTRKPYATVPAGFQPVDAVIPVTCLTEWLLLRASGLGPAHQPALPSTLPDTSP